MVGTEGRGQRVADRGDFYAGSATVPGGRSRIRSPSRCTLPWGAKLSGVGPRADPGPGAVALHAAVADEVVERRARDVPGAGRDRRGVVATDPWARAIGAISGAVPESLPHPERAAGRHDGRGVADDVLAVVPAAVRDQLE